MVVGITLGFSGNNIIGGDMKYFSMFSGIGGFEYGIQNAYRSKNRGSQTNTQGDWHESETSKEISTTQRPISSSSTDRIDERPLCVGYSEIDKYAIKVYERNFNGHKNYGDCTAIDAQQLPDFDLLVGGFPCQAFSIAGKRYGFQDTRGTLFFDIARILANKRPRHLVLENVKGLLSHDNGKTFQTILGVLSDLGYRVEWQVLNSKDFGVPQNRERVIIVGHLRGECRGQVFPITRQSNKYTTLGSTTETTVARTLTAGGHSGGNHSGMTILQLNQPKHSNDRVYGEDGISPTLNTMQGGNRQPFIEQKPRIRRLTPTECERLQGFSDDWTKYGEDEHGMRVDISDTQRYKMCGNAVTTNVIQAVMERLVSHEVPN